MPDREKVIKGLREMSYMATWKDIDRIRHKFQPIINDALALLKEHDTVDHALDMLRAHGWKDETKVTQDETANDPLFQRHACGALIVYRGRDVCPNCGRAVKWD